MSTFPQISEAEFEVMKIVWKYAPINTNEITEKLLPTTNWSINKYTTLFFVCERAFGHKAFD